MSVDTIGPDMPPGRVGPAPQPAPRLTEAPAPAAAAVRPATDAVAVSDAGREHARLLRLAAEYQAAAGARVAAMRQRPAAGADPVTIARAMLGLGA
jgi:hypothetical protein